MHRSRSLAVAQGVLQGERKRLLRDNPLQEQREEAMRVGAEGWPAHQDYGLYQTWPSMEDRATHLTFDNWSLTQQSFRVLPAIVYARYYDNPTEASKPLLVLEVEPLQRMPFESPPNRGYHISLGHWSLEHARLFRAVEREWAQPREVLLTGFVQGGAWRIERDNPVGRSKSVERVHALGGTYGSLHISL